MDQFGDVRSWLSAEAVEVPFAEVLAVPAFETAAAAHRAWRASAPGGLPNAVDLDPIRFPGWTWPRLSLIEVGFEAGDYRWRLCGEEVALNVGARLKDRRLSDLEREEGTPAALRLLLDRVCAERRAIFYLLRQVTADKRRLRTLGALLPYLESAAPDARVSRILGASQAEMGA